MADISSSIQSFINSLSNDAKLRSAMDFNIGDDFSGAPFPDVMFAINSDSEDNASDVTQQPKSYTISSKSTASFGADSVTSSVKSADVNNPSPIVQTKATADVKAPVVDRTAIKEKIKTKLKEMASQNDTPVQDTKALKALQKVASFLVKASDDGKINLPAEVVQKLKDFLAKGDDLKAADITQFMQDFSDAFKQMIVALPVAAATADPTVVASDDKDLKWPSDILDALKDLGLQGTASADKPLNVMDVLRTVKSLVNASEKAAVKTLDDKSKEAGLPQDQASILLVGNAANTAAPVKVDTTTVASADTTAPIAASTVPNAAPAATDAAPAADPAAVAAAVKDIQKNMEKAAQTGKVAVPVPAKTDKAPPAADAGKIVADPVANILKAPKAQPTASELNLSGISVTPVAKAPEKAASPSLMKISLDAQAPGQNNKAATDDNARDNNSRTYTPDATSAKANIAATAAATTSFAEVQTDVSTISDPVNNNAITPAGLNAVTDNTKIAGKVAEAATTSSLPSAATQQVIAQIQQKGDKSTQIAVQLTPADLGHVEVRLNIQKDGQVHTVVTVDKAETLALLQKDSAHLERSLQQAGLDADAKNMSFNLRDGNQAQQFSQGRKRFNRADIGTTVTEVAVNVAPEGQIITDNRVNYHA